MFGARLAGGLSGASAGFAIAINSSSVDLFTVCGSPAVPGSFVVTINAGVTIGSDGTNPAVRTGTFAAGSSVKLVNNGNVYGKGGAGDSGVGGDAISLSFPLTIDNSSGNIYGGGGGGGQGSTGSWFSGTSSGGGGGGGQGSPGGAAGSAGAASGAGGAGSNGGVGSVAGPGSGGPGGSGSDVNGSGSGGTGGTGGNWGNAGDTGDAGSDGSIGAAGGVGGYAVRQNGHAVTWLGGNNSGQVRGNVA